MLHLRLRSYEGSRDDTCRHFREEGEEGRDLRPCTLGRVQGRRIRIQARQPHSCDNYIRRRHLPGNERLHRTPKPPLLPEQEGRSHRERLLGACGGKNHEGDVREIEGCDIRRNDRHDSERPQREEPFRYGETCRRVLIALLIQWHAVDFKTIACCFVFHENRRQGGLSPQTDQRQPHEEGGQRPQDRRPDAHAGLAFHGTAQEQQQRNDDEGEKHSSLSRPTVAGIVSRMEGKGIVEAYVDASDRREKIVHIPEEGKEMFSGALLCVGSAEERLVSGLSDDEAGTLLFYLLLFRESLLFSAHSDLYCGPVGRG